MNHMSYGIIYYVDIKSKWKNYLNIIRNFKLRVSHIYKEENVCANIIVNAGLFADDLIWWDTLLNCSREVFSRDIIE